MSTKFVNTWRSITVAILGCVVLGASGCVSLKDPRKSTDSLDLKSLEQAGYSVTAEDGAVLAVDAKKDTAGVILEIHNGEKHREFIPMRLDAPMFVADVIKDAKLVERIGKINVSIMRVTTPNTPPVRMDVTFDSRGKSVMQEENYALQPNDRIVVRKNDRSWIDDAMERVGVGRKKMGG